MITPANANMHPENIGEQTNVDVPMIEPIEQIESIVPSDGLTRRQFGVRAGKLGLAVASTVTLGGCAPDREVGPGRTQEPITPEHLEKQRFDAVMAVSKDLGMSILTALGEPQEIDNLERNRNVVYVKYRNQGARDADKHSNQAESLEEGKELTEETKFKGLQLWFELTKGGRIYAAYKHYDDDGVLIRSVEVNMQMLDTNPAWAALRALDTKKEIPTRQQVVSAMISTGQLELISLEFGDDSGSHTIAIVPPDSVDPITNSAPLTADGTRLETDLNVITTAARDQEQVKFVNRMNEVIAINNEISAA